jgi:hypothetical protein
MLLDKFNAVIKLSYLPKKTPILKLNMKTSHLLINIKQTDLLNILTHYQQVPINKENPQPQPTTTTTAKQTKLKNLVIKVIRVYKIKEKLQSLSPFNRMQHFLYIFFYIIKVAKSHQLKIPKYSYIEQFIKQFEFLNSSDKLIQLRRIALSRLNFFLLKITLIQNEQTLRLKHQDLINDIKIGPGIGNKLTNELDSLMKQMVNKLDIKTISNLGMIQESTFEIKFYLVLSQVDFCVKGNQIVEFNKKIYKGLENGSCEVD